MLSAWWFVFGIECGCVETLAWKDNVLLPLGPPLPPDAVVAKRAESECSAGCRFPLS